MPEEGRQRAHPTSKIDFLDEPSQVNKQTNHQFNKETKPPYGSSIQSYYNVLSKCPISNKSDHGPYKQEVWSVCRDKSWRRNSLEEAQTWTWQMTLQSMYC